MRATYRPGTRTWLLLPAAVLVLSGLAAGCSSTAVVVAAAAAGLLHRRQPAQDLGPQPRQCQRRQERPQLPADRAEQSPDQRQHVRRRREVRLPVADHRTEELAVQPGDRDQVREGPASANRSRGGRASGHPSEDLGKQPAKCRQRQMPVTSTRPDETARSPWPRPRRARSETHPGRRHAARGGSVARRDQEGAPQMAKWNFVAMGQVGLTGWTNGRRSAGRPFDRPQDRTARSADPVADRRGVPRDRSSQLSPRGRCRDRSGPNRPPASQ